MQRRDELILERVENTLADFRAGMQSTHDLSVRIGGRTTQFIRILLICFLVIGLLLGYLIFTLKDDMGGYLVEMRAIHQSTVTMAESVQAMQITTQQMADTMQANLTAMPAMQRDTATMTQTLRKMEARLAQMTQQVATLPVMSEDMNAIVATLHQLQQEMTLINNTLTKMAFDMDDISRPMRMFPN